MHLPRFEYFRPSSFEEAAELLKDCGPGAKLSAGGTDLFPRMKYGLARPSIIVSLKGIPVGEPMVSHNGDLRIPALTTLTNLIQSSVVKEKAPLLREAALNAASNEIRNMATLGGNLCLENRCNYYNQSHTFQFVEPCFKRGGDRCYLVPKGKRCQAVFMGDTVPALLCLDGIAEIKSSNHVRRVPVQELYTGDPLQPLSVPWSEILTELILPRGAHRQGTAFRKFSPRGGLEFGALSVAALLRMENGTEKCVSARIAVGSLSRAPVRARKAETVLEGEVIGEDLFHEAASTVIQEIQAVMHHGYSIPYLRECLKVQTFRTLTLAAQRIRQPLDERTERP